MSYTKMHFHLVFATKNRYPFIKTNLEGRIYPILIAAFKEMDCLLLGINGVEDHVHVLCEIPPTKSISEILKYVKGMSSHVINQEEITKERFSWAKGYAAFAVSFSNIHRVAQYIKNQKEHHRVESGKLEYQKLLVAHGFSGGGDPV